MPGRSSVITPGCRGDDVAAELIVGAADEAAGAGGRALSRAWTSLSDYRGFTGRLLLVDRA